jgi:hypothetical protein
MTAKQKEYESPDDNERAALARGPGRETPSPHDWHAAQHDGYRMIERRARQASIKTKIGNHSLRATGNTDYLKSDGSLAETQDGE